MDTTTTPLMTVPQVRAAIERHGIATRSTATVDGPLLEAWDGRLQMWVTPPRTMHDLAVWLGY